MKTLKFAIPLVCGLFLANFLIGQDSIRLNVKPHLDGKLEDYFSFESNEGHYIIIDRPNYSTLYKLRNLFYYEDRFIGRCMTHVGAAVIKEFRNRAEATQHIKLIKKRFDVKNLKIFPISWSDFQKVENCKFQLYLDFYREKFPTSEAQIGNR